MREVVIMSSSFNIRNLTGDYHSSAYGSIDKKKINEITRNLCQSYKEGLIPEETFQEIIKNLLAFFIEHRLEDKLYSKSQKFENKIFRINSSINW